MRLAGSDTRAPAARAIARSRDHDAGVERGSGEYAGTARRSDGLEMRFAISEPGKQRLDAPLEQRRQRQHAAREHQ
jgi:hypothetical protein